MADFGRSRNDEPSLDAIVRSDQYIDALATGRSIAPQDRADAELARMLGGWRDEMRWPPATGLVSEHDAITALRAGLAEKQTTKRSRRGLSVVGAVAAAVLCLGGFGAVVSGAGPGDALYGLRTMLFGAPKQVRDAQVALAAQTQLNQVQDLISKGDWQQAQDKLVAVSTQVQSIGDEQQKQQLFDQWNQLSAKVVQKDPEATVPPGITYTVPPSATDLVPAVASPTSTPGAPSITVSTTSGPTSQEPGVSSTPSLTTEVPPTSSSVPTSPTQQATTTTAPTSTSAPTTTVPTTTTSAAPTTTTTTVPTTTVPTTTTTAGTTPTSTTTTAAPTTTTTAAPAAQSAVTTTTAVVQQSAASAPSSASAPAATSVAPPSVAASSAPAPQVTNAPAPTKSPPQIVITTTMVMPYPLPQFGVGHGNGN